MRGGRGVWPNTGPQEGRPEAEWGVGGAGIQGKQEGPTVHEELENIGPDLSLMLGCVTSGKLLKLSEPSLSPS